jgi:catechol 2,3-dioxygenase-like lactoylglutathione lyase family enzyme
MHHAALSTSNMDRLIAFYRDVVGFELVSESEWTANEVIDQIIGVPGSSARQAMLKAGGAYLEIFEYRAPAARGGERLRPNDHGYTHICLDVVDIEAEFDRLTAAGVVFNRRPADFGEIKAVYGRDPDGNVLEIQETSPSHPFSLGRLWSALPK